MLCGARIRRGVHDGGPARPGAPPGVALSRPFQPPEAFRKYCFECHGGTKHKGDVSIERLIRLSAQSSVGAYWEEWDKVAEMLEWGAMPPKDKAELFPPTRSARRPGRGSGQPWPRMKPKHAGDPGRITVRRLTSAEYAYAIRDLTGLDLDVGVDASSDSVGGEGFTNFGDVQFVEETSIERYLEAGKQVADHAVIGGRLVEHGPDVLGETALMPSFAAR